MTGLLREARPTTAGPAPRSAPKRAGGAFREDINGLRAVAVTLVILFHFKVAPFSGGFVGVDVFFVISGFLMTGIIVGGLEDGRFSLVRFFAARARRIVPALLGVSAFLLAFGWVAIDPIQYDALARQVLSALAFVSNVQFWSEAGYFDAQSESKWLLHTWSLSVEWQFYVLYPIALVATRRALPRLPLAAAIAAAALVSLAGAIVVTPYRGALAFFLLPTRAWEMLAGGLVALGPAVALTPARRTLLRGAGLALILAAALGYDGNAPWPSYRAVVPVAGTCLVILARAPRGLLLENPVSRWIGEWSYAIYLWHWPIVVACAYFDLPGGVWTKFGLLVLSIAAAAVLRPVAAAAVRRGAGSRRRPGPGWRTGPRWRPGPLALGLPYLGALAAAALVLGLAGVPGRQPSTAERMADLAGAPLDWAHPGSCGPAREGLPSPCRIPGAASDGGRTLVIGDSIAEQIYGRYAGPRGVRTSAALDFVTSGGCLPLAGTNRALPQYRCNQYVDAALALAASGRYARVVLASLWSKYLLTLDGICFVQEGRCGLAENRADLETKFDAVMNETAARLRLASDRGVEVVILSAFPNSAYDLPREMAKRLFGERSTTPLEGVDRDAFARSQRLFGDRLPGFAARAGAVLVDPVPIVCRGRRCVFVDERGRVLYRDAVHIRTSVIRSDPRYDFLDAVVSPGSDPNAGGLAPAAASGPVPAP